MVIQKKICMLGAFAVGKTSLVRRFVKSLFDDKYLTTVGVKIDKRTVRLTDREVILMLWDLEGQDAYNKLRTSYIRGTSGYLLIADGTRRETLGEALDLRTKVEAEIGRVPYLILLNKSDLTESWELDATDVQPLLDADVIVLQTSAKSGEGVEQAFLKLTEKMLEPKTGAHSGHGSNAHDQA
ncbi:MAG: Rab family GTPase [Pseudomonadota bacterium]